MLAHATGGVDRHFNGLLGIAIDTVRLVMNLEADNPRQYLLHAAARFIDSVKGFSGILRIAVVGSILTTKKYPKDIDLLVYIDDDADLEKIAAAGRRLKGSAQTRNLGADIFLADEKKQYIGRTCGWKICEFGIRMACRADHCGRRKYLNDDLSDLRLETDLVKNPPLVVWPAVAAIVKVPSDVMDILCCTQTQMPIQR